MQENDSNKPTPSTPRKDVSAWEQTLRWLDARWYSENKLREKLNKLHYPLAEIEDVIAKCREYNLVNDAALAEEFAKSQSSRGRGSHRIAFELRRHGLTGEAAENGLELIFIPRAPFYDHHHLTAQLKAVKSLFDKMLCDLKIRLIGGIGINHMKAGIRKAQKTVGQHDFRKNTVQLGVFL